MKASKQFIWIDVQFWTFEGKLLVCYGNRIVVKVIQMTEILNVASPMIEERLILSRYSGL